MPPVKYWRRWRLRQWRAARVLIVDDHALLRTGVANIINQEIDLEVVAEAANGLEGVEAFDTASARRGPARPADAGDGRRRGDPAHP